MTEFKSEADRLYFETMGKEAYERQVKKREEELACKCDHRGLPAYLHRLGCPVRRELKR